MRCVHDPAGIETLAFVLLKFEDIGGMLITGEFLRVLCTEAFWFVDVETALITGARRAKHHRDTTHIRPTRIFYPAKTQRLCNLNCTAERTSSWLPRKTRFMQSALSEVSNSETHQNNDSTSSTASQHGIHRPSSQLRSGRQSPRRARSPSPDARGSVLDVSELDHKLDRLNVASVDVDVDTAASYELIATAAGQRISEYENASVMPSNRQRPCPASDSKPSSNGVPFKSVQLSDFPNGWLILCSSQILTQVLSHLHPDSHGAVALVSKRFYALVTTPYAWRTAFLRYFPGHDALAESKKSSQQDKESEPHYDMIQSEARYFTRLTTSASWRSEYLLRTRLLRSVVRGKPGSGGVGSSIKSSQSSKKSGAVLTYNSKLPWMISTVHANFSGGRQGPKVVHGSRDLGIATVSDPTTGRLDKVGLDDPFSFQQLDETSPDLRFWGLDDGLAAVPNVLDVSQQYGLVGGEGFPGGRVYFKGAGDLRGKYLGRDDAIIDMAPEIPKIPELMEAISAVWIAKSSNVMQTTNSMVGIMAGSTLGVVTSYTLGSDSSGPRFSKGDMTARWVLCPGVPIVDIKVDDNYSLKRKALGRVWAVALNALGEVFYLRDVPTPPLVKGKLEQMVKHAWLSGRTAYWELIEATRRIARPDEFDRNVVRGSYSPRSPCDSMGLSKEQIVAESKEIEKFFRYKPDHWRKACLGWDMLRKLEVDFAGGGETRAGEGIFVVTMGHLKGEQASVLRLVRADIRPLISAPSGPTTPPAQPFQSTIFDNQAVPNGVAKTPMNSGPNTPQAEENGANPDFEEWKLTEFTFKSNASTEITASAIDLSTFAIMAPFEDPLHSGSQLADPPSTPSSRHATGEIPGRRARLLAIGTGTGSIVLWNMRDTTPVVKPVRVIQTDSPEVSSLGVSALYVVHGGSDGLVQAWDPLASTPEPIRTLNARPSGRVPRHILQSNPALQHANFYAVGAIYLDPDPTALRGVLAFGTFLRYWTYSSTNQVSGRKRRHRHNDVHGRLASRRDGAGVDSYIAAEAAEMRREQEHRSRELDRLRKRFGVGLAELTEEEALQYAQMISEESLLLDEQRRFSASDTASGSNADLVSLNGSSSGGSSTTETITPEPSISNGVATAAGASTSSVVLAPLPEETGPAEDDFEAQMQRAIRLSLMESRNDSGPATDSYSPVYNEQSHSSEDLDMYQEFQLKMAKRPNGKRKDAGKGSASASASASNANVDAMYGYNGASGFDSIVDLGGGEEMDDDLALALRLSMQEEEERQRRLKEEGYEEAVVNKEWEEEEDFPSLEVKGKGKGKGRA
ncbi:putative F-box/WD repeat-containing protein POF10 [Triangularia setosa]|uniref:F-box/WD repeat-containing protein POF10 n=1 Tax=Triangularia setosa TaxID=2587417 RepID=A0AAN6WAA1_9PEZI|nr:putative F-box/WD repeat-containing protein POF10 [Podospora setosa]